MLLTDQFLRKINYLRVSVTDRCDLRCVYCMKEKMNFLPKNEVLNLEEIERLCDNFIELGVEKIRLTGGEPLVRKNILNLIENLNKKKTHTNLKEITLTTNGSLLKKFANVELLLVIRNCFVLSKKLSLCKKTNSTFFKLDSILTLGSIFFK